MHVSSKDMPNAITKVNSLLIALIIIISSSSSSCECIINRNERRVFLHNGRFMSSTKRRQRPDYLNRIDNIVSSINNGGSISTEETTIESPLSSKTKLFDEVIKSYQEYMEIALNTNAKGAITSKSTKTTQKSKQNSKEQSQSLHPISKLGIFKNTWLSKLTGEEFNDYKNVENLSKECYNCCIQSQSSYNDIIKWKPDGKTSKVLQTYDCDDDSTDEDIGNALLYKMPSDTVLLWTAHLPKDGNDDDNDTDDEYYGYNLPLVKTRGLINGLSPYDIASLLMDSTRVQTYNKVSLGRKDIIVYQNGIHTDTTTTNEDNDNNDSYGGIGETKIVQNLTKPPLISKTVRFLTMMHARKLQLNQEQQSSSSNNGYIVISRAIPPKSKLYSNDNDNENLLKSEILLGVNLLRNVPNNSHDLKGTDLTSITHVNSPFVHPFVAAKAGLKGAIGFFNDVRSLGNKE